MNRTSLSLSLEEAVWSLHTHAVRVVVLMTLVVMDVDSFAY